MESAPEQGNSLREAMKSILALCVFVFVFSNWQNFFPFPTLYMPMTVHEMSNLPPSHTEESIGLHCHES